MQRGQNAEAHATRVGAGQMPSLRADRPSWPTPAEPRVEGGPRLDCRAPVHSHHSSAHPSTTQFLPTPPLPASMCTLRHTRSPHEHSPSSSEAGNLAKPSLPRGERGKLHHARGLASSPPSFPSLPFPSTPSCSWGGSSGRERPQAPQGELPRVPGKPWWWLGAFCKLGNVLIPLHSYLQSSSLRNPAHA